MVQAQHPHIVSGTAIRQVAVLLANRAITSFTLVGSSPDFTL
jgi:hypothetical protein